MNLTVLLDTIMKINNLILFIIFLCTTTVFSQTLKGKIENINGQVIPLSTVAIMDSINGNSIKEYTIARNGHYYILLKKIYNVIVIKVSAINYHSKTYIIHNPRKKKIYNIDFILTKKEITKLDEVVITANNKPFTIKKDTVSYNVKKYSDGTERKIEEIIKKLPGVEVNNISGEIKYNGKSIETVLLEGDNLFGYNYSLGTKNINVGIVNQIQAIENYSENPLLKGIENDGKVVLNLKLKKGKMDLSGNVDLASGLLNSNKFAVNVNANLLGISKKFKSFTTLSHNNTGTNNSPFDYFGYRFNLEQLKDDDFLSNKIIPETRFSNIFEDERVNINNQFFGNFNSIYKINRNLKLKTNFYYINDIITNNQSVINKYSFNNESLILTDDTRKIKEPSKYRGDFEIKYNITKSSLLEYDLHIQKENIKTNGTIISNKNTNISTYLDSRNNFIKQKLLYTKKLSNNKALQFEILQSFNTIPQDYKVTHLFDNQLNIKNDNQECSSSKKYYLMKAVLLGSTVSNNKYTFSIGGDLNISDVKSQLYSEYNNQPTLYNNSKNSVKYSKRNLFQLTTYNMTLHNWKFFFSTKFRILNQNITDNNDTVIKNIKGIFEPSLSIKYRLNSVSFFLGSMSYNKRSNTDRHLYSDIILIDNRTIINNLSSLKLQSISNFGLYYFLNDLFNQFQINLGLFYQKSGGNYFTKNSINENMTQITYFFSPHNINSLNFNFQSAKYISFLESTLKINFSYSNNQYVNIVNDSELRNNSSQLLKFKLFYKTAFDILINFENSINFGNSISKNNSNQFINKSFNDSFKVILSPVKQWHILLSYNYHLPSLTKKSVKYVFLDASIRYKPKRKKFELDIIAKNLLNKSYFEQIQTTDYSTNIYKFDILPRYFLLNYTYNF